MRLLPALLLAMACSAPPGPARSDAGYDPRQSKALPKCPASASVTVLDDDGGTDLIGSGQRVPVELGFQGFLMVQVALRSSTPLAQQVDVSAELTTPEGTDIVTGFKSWATHAVGSGAETDSVPIVLNDVPRPQLVNQQATIELWVTQESCRLIADADVVLALKEDWSDAGGLGDAGAEGDAGDAGAEGDAGGAGDAGEGSVDAGP